MINLAKFQAFRLKSCLWLLSNTYPPKKIHHFILKSYLGDEIPRTELHKQVRLTNKI